MINKQFNAILKWVLEVFMKKIMIYITLVIIGVIIGILIMNIPAIRYDLNYNGKVDIADFIKYHNYYINH